MIFKSGFFDKEAIDATFNIGNIKFRHFQIYFPEWPGIKQIFNKDCAYDYSQRSFLLVCNDPQISNVVYIVIVI